VFSKNRVHGLNLKKNNPPTGHEYDATFIGREKNDPRSASLESAIANVGSGILSTVYSHCGV
jgi:hypothetical protein